MAEAEVKLEVGGGALTDHGWRTVLQINPATVLVAGQRPTDLRTVARNRITAGVPAAEWNDLKQRAQHLQCWNRAKALQMAALRPAGHA